MTSLKDKGGGYRQRLKTYVKFPSTHGTFASPPSSCKAIKLLISPECKYIRKCCSLYLQNSMRMPIYSYLHCRQSFMQCTTGYYLGRQCSLSADASASIFHFSVFIVGKGKDSDGKPHFSKSIPNHYTILDCLNNVQCLWSKTIPLLHSFLLCKGMLCVYK